jgi:CheY-like chemotaxis protein
MGVNRKLRDICRVLQSPHFGPVREKTSSSYLSRMSFEIPFSVILLEESPELQETIRTLLERAGYVVECSADVDGAMKLLRAAARPCILLWDPMTADITLPILAESAARGAPVATLPIGVAIGPSEDGSNGVVTKRLTSAAAVLSIVREHCPLRYRAPASVPAE